MYDLFVMRNILPGEYYGLSAGEKLLLRAFFEKMNEERRQAEWERGS